MKKLFSSLIDYLKKTDTMLLALCVAATVYGMVLIRSTANTGSSLSRTQLLALFFGVMLYFLFSLIDVDILAEHWKLMFVAGVGLILLLFSPLGRSVGGNRAWLRFMGIGVQPAEVVKIIFTIILAHLITTFSEKRRLNHVLSLAALSLVFAVYFGMLIVISHDLGNALVYLIIFAVMLFAGGLQIYWFVIALTSLLVASPYLWTNFLRDDQRNRIIALFDPERVDADGLGITWQANQAKAAIASGRIFGMGLGKGTMTQSGSVPLQSSDFIFTVAGEELGIVGCLAIIALLTAITIRCVVVGLRSQSKLGALITVGFASWIAFQTFENIGMCLGVTPVVGLTLPFFSYGGSSLATLYAAMGIVSGIKMKPKPVMFSKY